MPGEEEQAVLVMSPLNEGFRSFAEWAETPDKGGMVKMPVLLHRVLCGLLCDYQSDKL